VKRGLGTIRQDINVSIKDGAIIEIKGVQKLNIIKQVVKYEVQRQLELLAICKKLQAAGVKATHIKKTVHDVTPLFTKSESKVIKSALKRNEGVYALLLPGFAGFVGQELQPNRRLGSEFADYARFWGNVQGIFHTDELPKYGITESDIKRLQTHLKAKPVDAIILVAADTQAAKEALEAVAQRAKDALKGVPEETRGPLDDGTTRYMRPRPGAARMYPETDVAPVAVEPERLQRIKSKLPELPEKKLEKFRKQFHLSEELAQIMIRSLRIDLFEEIAHHHPELAVTVAATLETLWTNLEREGVAVDDIPEEQIFLLFTRLSEGRFAKEALEDLLTWLGRHLTSTVDEGIQELGLTTITKNELRTIIENIVSQNAAMVKERGDRAMGPLMGLVMKEVRGRADGKLVNELLRRVIQAHLAK